MKSFFKKSKTKPDLITTYTYYGNGQGDTAAFNSMGANGTNVTTGNAAATSMTSAIGSSAANIITFDEGNTVQGLAKKDKGDKLVLLKSGDTEGNETAYDVYPDNEEKTQQIEDEIDADEMAFAISREMFSAELIRYIDPSCAPKYSRFYEKDTLKPLIGSEFITSFKSWAASYNFEQQTIYGHKINKKGMVEFPEHAKRIRGLGTSAVLLVLLGRSDRGNTNWGLVENYNLLQVTLIDFGRCLCPMLFLDEEQNLEENTFPTPVDLVKAVFQAYPTEAPLPVSLLQSPHIRFEIYETLDKLYNMPSEVLENIGETNFQQFPLFKKALLEDKRKGILHLYNQFTANEEFIAVHYINEGLGKTDLPIKLSELDEMTANYLLSIYYFIKPQESPFKTVFFHDRIRELFKANTLIENISVTPSYV